MISITTLRNLFVTALAAFATQAAAADPSAVALAELVKPLLLAPARDFMPPGWNDIEADRAIRWAQGPVMTDKPAPDGSFFARPGQAMFAGRPMMVVATGARSMVFNYYFRNPGAPIAPDDIVDGFRQAGFTVAPARCASNPAQAAPKRWYRLAHPQKRPAFLYVGPLASGGQGYTLFLDQIPPMTQAEAMAYTDACQARPGAAPAGAAPRIANGQAGVVAVIEALLRPAGSPAAIPWASLSTLPAITWNRPPPMKMTNPYGDGGADNNPRLLEGRFKTPTTEMTAIATGDDRVATRFQLIQGGNLPRGAVFDGLIRDGYAITAIRCGKPYTQMSENWFRISGGGKQPAILYRAMYNDGGRTTETYGLRIDNLAPPMQPGQTAAPGGRCPG
jgi:hypothetical protein